jgi:hypothetical protein
LNKYEIVTNTCEIPENCLILAMTDGVYESLCVTTEKTQNNVTDRKGLTIDYRYRESRLDANKIAGLFSDLKSDDPVDRFAMALMTSVVADIERKRIAADPNTFQKIGDDVALTVIRISDQAFTDAFRLCVTPELQNRATVAPAAAGLDRFGTFPAAATPAAAGSTAPAAAPPAASGEREKCIAM